MGVTFRDICNIERGSIGADGSLTSFAEVARGVRLTFWETLKKSVVVEGEVYTAVAEAMSDPNIDVLRRDILVIRDRRYEVVSAFPGRNLEAVHRFNYLVLREAT